MERDPKRFKILKGRVNKAGAESANENDDKGVTCINVDFLEPMLETKENTEIKIIVCDPSCSGSGMRLHGQEKPECTLKHKTPED